MTMQNHFALFNLPAEFALDTAQLDAAYREVQNKVHPDKFVSAPDAEKEWQCNGQRVLMKRIKY